MTRTISNSETATLTTCEAKWLFNYGYNVMPKSVPLSEGRRLPGASLGILGHDVLAVYYTARRDGEAHSAAQRLALDALARQYLVKAAGDNAKQLYMLSSLLMRYFNEVAAYQTWEVVEVEKEYYLPITDEYQYGLRLDLLVKEKTGEFLVIDHKFVWDFMNLNMVRLNAQIPKYIGACRANGIPVRRGYLNQLRTRFSSEQITKGEKSHDDLFRSEVISPESTKIQNILREHIISSKRIVQLKAMSPEERQQNVRRVFNNMICKTCSFVDLCAATLSDQDISLMLRANYEPNTYGYNEIEEVA